MPSCDRSTSFVAAAVGNHAGGPRFTPEVCRCPLLSSGSPGCGRHSLSRLKAMSVSPGKKVFAGLPQRTDQPQTAGTLYRLLVVIDVASDKFHTADEIVGVSGEATKYVPKERIRPCTNCCMAPMARDVAMAKLSAFGAGPALVRQRFTE